MTERWTSEDNVLAIARGYQQACVLMAGAELGVFDVLSGERLSAKELAERLETDLRATTMLADALAAMEILLKEDERYALAPGIGELLTEPGEHSALAMVRHLANCQRSWTQLSSVVTTGRPANRGASIRGPEADLASFIEAMNEINRSMARDLVTAIGPPEFHHLLDLGGGPGTWTIAFLREAGKATATLFDRPDVIPIAQRHIEAAGMEDRVGFVGGDFSDKNALPSGADLVWISAIVHQNSREENRALFAKARAALVDGGRVLIRDVVMEKTRTIPPEGAMFAINMLVNTPGGGTYTFDELSEDLVAAGFREVAYLRRGQFMDSVIEAVK